PCLSLPLWGIVSLSSMRGRDMVMRKSGDDAHKLTLAHTLSEFADCADLTHRSYPDKEVDLVFFNHQVDQSKLHEEVMNPILHMERGQLPRLFEQNQFANVDDPKALIIGILTG